MYDDVVLVVNVVADKYSDCIAIADSVRSALEIKVGTFSGIEIYKVKENGSFGIGFIAEDTHPWLSGENQKGHNFGNHLGLLTKAIQEQQEQIEALKLEIKQLKDGRE